MKLDSRGYTLVEAAIAVLLTAVMAGSVLSVALSSKRASGLTMRRLIADQASRQLSERLKDYVTGDYLTPKAQTGIDAPLGPDNWQMAGFKMPGNKNPVEDSCSGCWALQPGTHKLKYFLPDWFDKEMSSPFKGEIKYEVTLKPLIPASAGSNREVKVEVTWTDL